MSDPRNKDPFQPWNDYRKDDPFAAHNGFDSDNPFKPWNNPFGEESDLTDREAESYGIKRRNRDEDESWG